MEILFDQARSYAEKQSTNQFEDGLRLIELLAPGKGDSVLDLGCGTGNLTKVLASKVEKVGTHHVISPIYTGVLIQFRS